MMASGQKCRTQQLAVSLLFAVGVLNLFDRQLINVLAQDIKSDLQISDMKLGMLTGTAFGLLYATLGIPLGRLADRVDRVRLIALALVVWSAFTACCGLATHFVWLFVARVGVGIGEAASQPASTSLIPDLFSERRRTLALSLMLAGAPVGSFLGLLAGGLVGSAWGWRAAFELASLPGLCVAAVLAASLRDPTGGTHRPPSAAYEQSLGRTVLRLLRRPGYFWLLIANMCSAFVVYGPSAWLPVLFLRVHRMSMAEVSVFTAFAVGLGGAVGTFGAGWLSDLLYGRVREAESKISIIVAALSTPALLLVVLSDYRPTAVVSMYVFNICAFAFLAPTVTLVQRAATLETRALAVALLASTGNILSLAIGLPLVGLISDRFTAAYGVQGIRYAVACCAGAGLASAVAHWRAQKALRGLPCEDGERRPLISPRSHGTARL